ncbi:MAG: phosphoribosylformylglycinamidine synthase [Patescibacteria group bacterium]|nr:phosphoribosylformylglycinamidine synthase [Patescibacteria group bacterium]
MNTNKVLHFYREASSTFEYCFNVETSEPLTTQELNILTWLLAETFDPNCFSKDSLFQSKKKSVIEVGPRMNFATAFSTNAVAICHACGLNKITRLEISRRHVLPQEDNIDTFLANHHDRMTECHYPRPLKTFATGIQPKAVRIIPLMNEGVKALRRINQKMGLGMDDWDLNFYHNLFVSEIGRDPTDVECFQLGQANSEHSRHWFFKGKLVRNGQVLPETLLQIVQTPLQINSANSLIAFSDNASAITGYKIQTLIPKNSGICSPFALQQREYHITFNAETHNFPSGVAPFPGAETGTGGRIRDGQGVGQGGLVVAGTAGYCTGNLLIADNGMPSALHIKGENPDFAYPGNLATPLKIMIEESNGASDYGNKFGEPIIQGFVRTFGLRLPNGERREWIKPIMFTGGVGQIDNQHTKKKTPEPGMVIIQVGGPAYRIGMGGGSASSMIQGANTAELDFNAVQRGDAEMEQKVNRVIRACIEMGSNNPILSIHDQGAGGPCNVLTELVEPAGGRIDIRQIQVGDATMSVLEIWGAEYQERDAFLIYPNQLEKFKAICRREKINCEVLGNITGNGRIVVYDNQDDSYPVDLDLGKILCDMPQKSFKIDEVPEELAPLDLPDISVKEALRQVFRLPSVCSKGYLVRKVDRSVTGLIARQQCCGPLQLPVSDVSAVAQSHFGLTGSAISIGEQPIKMLVNSSAGARMAVAEALTNMVFARISDLKHIKCSANWMWAAKLPGEGAKLHDAALAMRDLMIALGIAVDGGKDSLSMAAKVGDETVKAPGQLVISAYATMPDITQILTPDIKQPGNSSLLYIPMAPGKHRLGGSALAQINKQIGNESPDVDNPELLKNVFLAIQAMIDHDLVLAGHDISDGGLITTLVEMSMSGNCGIKVKVPDNVTTLEYLFSEELGLVLEVLPKNEFEVASILKEYGVSPCLTLGNSCQEHMVFIYHQEELVFGESTSKLLEWWESTSDQLELHQIDPDLAWQQAKRHRTRISPVYSLSFNPQATPPEVLNRTSKPKVAIIREEGSNGDREMISAFFAAGFTPVDVTMTDLLNGEYDLDSCRGIVFVGGFSYADVLDSAKGWAGIILFNPKLRKMFERFYRREDTFSLGVCNGCQLMALLGWVPWKGIDEDKQPRFIQNTSGLFESRWVTTKIMPSPSIMLGDMANSVLGIWVAHGEGQLHCPDSEILKDIVFQNLTPLVYTDETGRATESYPLNPNGSPKGITALCSPDGRHLAMMPHPERVFLKWQWPWMPKDWRYKLKASPWLQMFQNARKWCDCS